MIQNELEAGNLEKLDKYTKDYSGGVIILPEDRKVQKEIVERAVYWLLSGMYPDTPIPDDEDARIYLADVKTEAREQADKFGNLDPVSRWAAQYDYWESSSTISFIKGSVSVFLKRGLPESFLRVSPSPKKVNFVATGLVGFSDKVFEPIQESSWSRREFDGQRVKAKPEDRAEAYNDFKTVAKNLGVNLEEAMKEIQDYAQYEYYEKVLGYKRTEEIFRNLNGGEPKPNEFMASISKYVDKFFAELTPEERDKVADQEIKIFTSAHINLNRVVQDVGIKTEIGMQVVGVPCKIDGEGNFSINFENAESFDVNSTTKINIDRDTTPQKVARTKIELDIESANTTDGTNTARSVYKNS